MYNKYEMQTNREKGMWTCVRPETRSPRFGPPSEQPEPAVVLAAVALFGLGSAKLMGGQEEGQTSKSSETAPQYGAGG
jgi:hypothetical protein